MVRRTNEGATGHANAAVKRINALEIGQNANKAWKAAQNMIVSIAAPPGGGGTGVAAPGGPGGGKSQRNGARNRQQLMADRYVNNKGKPLPYTPDYPYAKHPCNEFSGCPSI